MQRYCLFKFVIEVENVSRAINYRSLKKRLEKKSQFIKPWDRQGLRRLFYLYQLKKPFRLTEQQINASGIIQNG